MANTQTKATKKYQEKAGYVAKSFKIKKDTAERFKNACERQNESQARVITNLMENYIEEADKSE